MKRTIEYQTGSRVLNTSPVAFYPAYKIIMGTTSGGVILSQLMFQFSVHGDRIYHRDNQLIRATASSENEIRGAKKKLKKLPWLHIFLKGVPPVTQYRIDWKLYDQYMKEFSISKEWREYLALQNVQINSAKKTKLISPKGRKHSESNYREKELTLSPREKFPKLDAEIVDRDGLSPKRITELNRKVMPMELPVLAARLKKTLSDCFNINIKTPIKHWANDLNILHIEGGVKIPRIVKVAEGFCKAISGKGNSDPYMPTITDAADFRRKFIKIEAYLKRADQNAQAAGVSSDGEYHDEHWGTGDLLDTKLYRKAKITIIKRKPNYVPDEKW